MLLGIVHSCFGSPYYVVREDPYFMSSFIFLSCCLLIMFFVLKCIKIYPLSKQDGWESIYHTPDILGQELNYHTQALVVPRRKTRAVFLKVFVFLLVAILILTPLKDIAFSNLAFYHGF